MRAKQSTATKDKEEDEEDKIVKDYCAAHGIPDLHTEEFLFSFGAFLEAVVFPRAIAQRRRKAGDPSARARDFCPACGIGEDLRNLCCARRDDCPHAVGATVDVIVQNSPENWARRQALCREIVDDYMASLQAAEDPFKEFARYRAKRKQRRVTRNPKGFCVSATRAL